MMLIQVWLHRVRRSATVRAGVTPCPDPQRAADAGREKRMADLARLIERSPA